MSSLPLLVQKQSYNITPMSFLKSLGDVYVCVCVCYTVSSHAHLFRYWHFVIDHHVALWPFMSAWDIWDTSLRCQLKMPKGRFSIPATNQWVRCAYREGAALRARVPCMYAVSRALEKNNTASRCLFQVFGALLWSIFIQTQPCQPFYHLSQSHKWFHSP